MSHSLNGGLIPMLSDNIFPQLSPTAHIKQPLIIVVLFQLSRFVCSRLLGSSASGPLPAASNPIP